MLVGGVEDMPPVGCGTGVLPGMWGEGGSCLANARSRMDPEELDELPGAGESGAGIPPVAAATLKNPPFWWSAGDIIASR
jgi:hypothetical protein